MKFEIKSRYDQSVIYTADIPDDTESGLQKRVALEQATAAKAYLREADLRGAYLRGAYLREAYLRGAYLRGAYLRGAYLRGADLGMADLGGADLRGAYLRGADLRGAYLRGAYLGDGTTAIPEATTAQAIANLDKVRELILDNRALLEMDHWHDNDDWRERTCAEEAVCGTTHCLAGWLQVCATDPEIRKMETNIAGIICAPVASNMFFRDGDQVLEWLEQRKYVEESNAG